MLILILSLIAALVPALIYAQLLHWFDRFDDEPLPLARNAFVWGALPAVVIAILGEVLIGAPDPTWDAQSAELFDSVGVAPFVEEIAKGIIVYAIFIFARREFESPLRGIIYGALAGCGFAMTENVLYFLVGYAAGGWGSWTMLVVWRAFVFGMGHALYTGLTGLGLGLATVNAPWFARALFAITGLGTAMLFHAIHNLGATLVENNPDLIAVSAFNDWGGVLLVALILWLGVAFEKTWVARELREELDAGLIAPRDYALACSHRARWRAWLGAWARFSPQRAGRISRLADLLSELAFRKRQMRERALDYAREIRDLRQEIVFLRALN